MGYDDAATQLRQSDDIRIGRLIRAPRIEKIRISGLDRGPCTLNVWCERYEESSVVLDPGPQLRRSDGIELILNEVHRGTFPGVDELLDSLPERAEDINGVEPRLPVHEEVGVEGVQESSALYSLSSKAVAPALPLLSSVRNFSK